MNIVDIVNKISVSKDIPTGRAEMIISIIIEKISDKLKKDGEVAINNFGKFSVQTKAQTSSSFKEQMTSVKKYILFEPDITFLETLNS